MIYHFAQSSAQTTAQPAEGIPVIPGLNPYQQRGIPASYRMPDDGARPDDKENSDKRKKEKTEDKSDLPQESSTLFGLIMDKDYRELFEFFMIPDHHKILQIRSAIRMHHAVTEQTLYRSAIMHEESLDDTRHRLYLFSSRVQKKYVVTG